MRRRPYDSKRTHEVGAHLHHSSRIVELSAIIGRRKYSDELPVRLKLIAVLHHLVRATDQTQLMALEKIINYVFSKRIRNSSKS